MYGMGKIYWCTYPLLVFLTRFILEGYSCMGSLAPWEP
jgi:hypothetical protein